MEKIKVSIINGVEIIAVKDEDNNIFVPVKPLCEAIGISFSTQRIQINDHPILASTVSLCNTVGADGKDREMFCLPFDAAHGWLLTINPKNVAESARENVILYLKECYKALGEHFRIPFQERLEADRKEKELTQTIEDCKANEKKYRTIRLKAAAELQKSMDSRLKNIPS